jgi:hypothetical protein
MSFIYKLSLTHREGCRKFEASQRAVDLMFLYFFCVLKFVNLLINYY